MRKQLTIDEDDLPSQASTLAGYFTVKASNAYKVSEGNSNNDNDND